MYLKTTITTRLHNLSNQQPAVNKDKPIWFNFMCLMNSFTMLTQPLQLTDWITSGRRSTVVVRSSTLAKSLSTTSTRGMSSSSPKIHASESSRMSRSARPPSRTSMIFWTEALRHLALLTLFLHILILDLTLSLRGCLLHMKYCQDCLGEMDTIFEGRARNGSITLYNEAELGSREQSIRVAGEQHF